MSKIIDGIAKDLKALPETLKAKTGNVDKKKLILMNLPYILAGGVALRLVVYFKAKNAKKFRQGVEYGSARCGA